MTKLFTGGFKQYYHTVPSDIDLNTISPKREMVLKSLAQISYKDFPYFIADVLEIVERHTDVHVTDGPGDEKQDILSNNSKGIRQLTQCKHTINQDRFTGNDIDLLTVACLRKKCKSALFVTNSDLTPQGKRYITDEEYSRGWEDSVPVIDVKYWNGLMIWDKIKNNRDILNKWFSGYGQTHGLRNFNFSLVINLLPLEKKWITNWSDAIIKNSSNWEELIKGISYKYKLEDYDINLKFWFVLEQELKTNYVNPFASYKMASESFHGIKFEVSVPSNLTRYDIDTIQEKITKNIGSLLPKLDTEHEWWHIIVTGSKGFLYIHDLGQPAEVELGLGKSFISDHRGVVMEEREYCLLDNVGGYSVNNPDDNGIQYIHTESQTSITLMFEQKMHPLHVYHYQLQQNHEIRNLQYLDVRAIENIDERMMMRIRRLIPYNYFSLSSNKGTFFWFYPEETEDKAKSIIEKKIENVGLKLLHVRDDEKKKIIENIQTDLPTPIFSYEGSSDNLTTPIMLNKRMFWMSRKLKTEKLSHDQIFDTLTFKIDFEKNYGVDLMEGKKSIQLNSSEILDILFDFFSIRGSRMIDISFGKDFIDFNLRMFSIEIKPSSHIMEKLLTYFDGVIKQYLEWTKIELSTTN